MPHRKPDRIPGESKTKLKSARDDPGIWEQIGYQNPAGFRNRPGRSGLDFMDSLCELWYMVGRFIRVLILGQVRTRNPLGITLMALCGIGFVFGLGQLYGPMLKEDWSTPLFFADVLIIVPLTLLGLLLVWNAWTSARGLVAHPRRHRR